MFDFENEQMAFECETTKEELLTFIVESEETLMVLDPEYTLQFGLDEMDVTQLQTTADVLSEAIDDAFLMRAAQMGRCVMGYKWRWDASSNRFACEGGTHFATKAEILRHCKKGKR